MVILLMFGIDRATIQHIGSELKRPECVVVDKDGTLLVSDARGGVTSISKSGRQTFIAQTIAGDPINDSMPNGFVLLDDGSILLANAGTQRIERTTSTGETTIICEQIEGAPLGMVNYATMDDQGRIWFTVSTQLSSFIDALRPDWADGYIGLIDQGQTSVVADALAFPNELCIDSAGRHLYVAETAAKRILRYPIGPAGLGKAQVYGPSCIGDGFPDGVTFDSAGNLWVAIIGADRVAVIDTDQTMHNALEDGDPAGVRRMEDKFSGCELNTDDMIRASGAIAPLTTSIAFSEKEPNVGYLGSLGGQSIARFEVAVSYQPQTYSTLADTL